MKRVLALLALLFAGAAHAQTTTIPPGATWYWQLSGTVKTGYVGARVYDIDMENALANPAMVQKLKADGHAVICYFSAGTYEAYRSDAKLFPASVKGRKLSGWNEYYVDIRDPTVRSIMQGRMDRSVAAGCHGFEPDVLDAWSNRSGFPITKADEISYIRWLAAEGHARGLLVALKNSPEIVRDLVGDMDFVIAEECFAYSECASYSPFIAAGKAVLAAEYTSYSDTKCKKAAALGFSLVFYNLDLDGKKYRPCP